MMSCEIYFNKILGLAIQHEQHILLLRDDSSEVLEAWPCHRGVCHSVFFEGQRGRGGERRSG
jgi:hypothetical protein